MKFPFGNLNIHAIPCSEEGEEISETGKDSIVYHIILLVISIKEIIVGIFLYVQFTYSIIQ